MRLLSCKIENFGCLSAKAYSFEDGLNILVEPNGSGKSTLTVFIKAMLFGLPTSTKRSLAENERKHYTPWNGGRYGGSLCFEAAGKSYRIERFFGAREKEDTFALYDLATRLPSADFSANLGEELFGVDADGFERSVYISQRMPFKGPEKNLTIFKKLGDLLEVSDDLADYEGAAERLEKAMRRYKTLGEKGIIWDIRREIEDKNDQIHAAEAAAQAEARLLAETEELMKQKALLEQERDEAQAQRRQAEHRRLLEEQGDTYRLLSDAFDADTRELMPLEKFFSKRLPTEAVIAEAEEVITSLEGDRIRYDMAKLPTKEQERLDALRARYPAPPMPEEIAKAEALLTDYTAEGKTVQATLPKDTEEFRQLKHLFEKQFPTEAEIEEIHRATEAYDDAEARLLVSEEERKKEKKHLPPAVKILGILSGVGILLVIACLILRHIPLLIVSGCLTLLFGGLLIPAIRRIPHTENIALTRLQECKAHLTELLSPYDIADPSPSVRAKLLFKDIARYRTLCKEDAEREEKHTAAKKAAADLHREIMAILSRYGITNEPSEGVKRLANEREELCRLLKAEEEQLTQRRELDAVMEKKSAFLTAFFSYYEPIVALPFREALNELRRMLVLSKECLARYEKDRQRLLKFLEESGFDPKEPLPPYIGEAATFAKRERELGDRLIATEKSITATAAETEHQAAIVRTLPNLELQRKALAEKLAGAEHTLSLLQATHRVLKDSKEDLSTRYLKDIEHHFSGYLSLLSSHSEGFRFNTELSLSAERAGEMHPAEALSRGEQDLVAFCARLALVDAIFTEESPFLILDDPFVNLDDSHYVRALTLLSRLSNRFQILYTSCSSARIPHKK